jgi:hypothetical protein
MDLPGPSENSTAQGIHPSTLYTSHRIKVTQAEVRFWGSYSREDAGHIRTTYPSQQQRWGTEGDISGLIP